MNASEPPSLPPVDEVPESPLDDESSVATAAPVAGVGVADCPVVVVDEGAVVVVVDCPVVVVDEGAGVVVVVVEDAAGPNVTVTGRFVRFTLSVVSSAV